MARRKGNPLVGLILVLAVIAYALENWKVWLPWAAVIAVVLWAMNSVFTRRAQLKHKRLTLEDLDRMSGSEFEKWVTDSLTSSGITAENIRDSGDFGVDVIADIDGVRVGIQAKRYASNVGNDAVQQAIAGCDYHSCQVAAVVTQAGYTKAARAQADRGHYPVVLVDRANLHQLVSLLQDAAAQIGNGPAA